METSSAVVDVNDFVSNQGDNLLKPPVAPAAPAAPVAPVAPQGQQVRLVDVPITNENVSLNVMVGFLNLAQKKGVFSFDESAKIHECISIFKKDKQ